MKTYKLAHLFPRLMSLYGEYGNIVWMEKLLREQGLEAERVECEDGELPPDADFIYAGSGTETALMAAAERLLPRYDGLRRAMDGGALLLATGNAMALFGTSIRRGDRVIELPGLCGYETAVETEKRFSGDALTAGDGPFAAPLVGYINTACIFTGVETPLTRLALGADLGNDKRSPAEGVVSGRFFGAQLTGPLLVKNPPAAAYLFEALTGQALPPDGDGFAARAYASAVSELEKRVGK